MQIDIDFEVFKALTARRQTEEHSYNDVLRQLLELDPTLDSELDPEHKPALHDLQDAIKRPAGFAGFYTRGVALPDGTQLRARYKQREYTAKILGGKWLDQDGHERSSASAAASAITHTNINGLRFWEAKRPNDSGWRRLELLRQ